MNDFWEWRSSSREFDGKPDDIGGGQGSERTRRGEVGLIIGVHPGHDFDVRPEFILGIALGEIAIPRIAEFMVAPGPLLHIITQIL